MNRREFLSHIGLGGLLITVPSVTSAESNEISEPILQALNQTDVCSGNFRLMAQYDPEPFKINNNNSLIPVCPQFNKTVEIILKPGPDGNLYINHNGTWKRILTT